MKIQRSDLDGMIKLAQSRAGRKGKTMFVFATAEGYVVHDSSPPPTQVYYRVMSNGSVMLMDRWYESNAQVSQ